MRNFPTSYFSTQARIRFAERSWPLDPPRGSRRWFGTRPLARRLCVRSNRHARRAAVVGQVGRALLSALSVRGARLAATAKTRDARLANRDRLAPGAGISPGGEEAAGRHPRARRRLSCREATGRKSQRPRDRGEDGSGRPRGVVGSRNCGPRRIKGLRGEPAGCVLVRRLGGAREPAARPVGEV
jgi:hypothetical protein